jgi:hypothetical protein
MQEQTTTLEKIRATRESIASAQSAMDKAQSGLSSVESIAETAEKARRHPMITATALFGLALLAVLTILGIRTTED